MENDYKNFIRQHRKYSVDIVFCVDLSDSMNKNGRLNKIKADLLSVYFTVVGIMQRYYRYPNPFRVRIIGFRNYLDAIDTGCTPMLATRFFNLPEELGDFQAAVESMETGESCMEGPEDGLEALAFAMDSKWNASAGKCRHIIFLWSDNAPNPLGHGSMYYRYPKNMAKDIQELTSWWGTREACGKMPYQRGKGLALFTPDEGLWHTIGDNWGRVVLVPFAAGENIEQDILNRVLNLLIIGD